MNKFPYRLTLLFVITICLAMGWSGVHAQTTTNQDQVVLQAVTKPLELPGGSQVQADHLRVAISPVSPFAFHKGDEWTGFSIDLWDAIAKRLGVSYEWVVVKSRAEQLQAVQRGEADIAVAAVPLTAEAE
jgi:polar amino acid transport system substrate-binding protein